VATLDQHQGHCDVFQPIWVVPGDRGICGDHFGSGVVKISGYMRH
jgi:hypothetical protein